MWHFSERLMSVRLQCHLWLARVVVAVAFAAVGCWALEQSKYGLADTAHPFEAQLWIAPAIQNDQTHSAVWDDRQSLYSLIGESVLTPAAWQHRETADGDSVDPGKMLPLPLALSI